MKYWLIKDKQGTYLFNYDPVWDENTQIFVDDKNKDDKGGWGICVDKDAVIHIIFGQYIRDIKNNEKICINIDAYSQNTYDSEFKSVINCEALI